MQSTQPRSILMRIFVSLNEPRLRAGWRLLLQTILMMVISIISLIILGVLIAIIFKSRPGWISGMNFVFFLNQIVEFFAFGLSIYFSRRVLDKRSFVSLGFKINTHALVDILTGIAITFLMMGLIYTIETAAGWLAFKGFAWEEEPVAMVGIKVIAFFFVLILVGLNEELLVRGYQLQTIASGLTLAWGVILSSAIFGLLHLGNPNATWISAAGIFLAGLFLAYAYVRTGQLWLSIGLHIGWNIFEGVVFGFPVSGLDIYKLNRIQIQGPTLWTGGAFGPEAGLIVIPALFLGTMLIQLYTKSLHKSSS